MPSVRCPRSCTTSSRPTRARWEVGWVVHSLLHSCATLPRQTRAAASAPARSAATAGSATAAAEATARDHTRPHEITRDRKITRDRTRSHEMTRDDTRWHEMARDLHEMTRDRTRWHEIARDDTGRPKITLAHRDMALTRGHISATSRSYLEVGLDYTRPHERPPDDHLEEHT